MQLKVIGEWIYFIVALPTHSYNTISISAGFDYEPLSINLTFSSTTTRIDLNVTILDDSIVERTEQFEGQLTAVTIGPTVILDPQIAQLFILDDPQDSTLILKHWWFNSIAIFFID